LTQAASHSEFQKASIAFFRPAEACYFMDDEGATFWKWTIANDGS
jgi:hypothetical protein